jgi:hypothetical protein
LKHTTEVPVSERALLARINRKLAHEGERVLKKRSAWAAWGPPERDFYAIDINRNMVIADHVDLESWGKELGVFAEWEVLR